MVKILTLYWLRSYFSETFGLSYCHGFCPSCFEIFDSDIGLCLISIVVAPIECDVAFQRITVTDRKGSRNPTRQKGRYLGKSGDQEVGLLFSVAGVEVGAIRRGSGESPGADSLAG